MFKNMLLFLVEDLVIHLRRTCSTFLIASNVCFLVARKAVRKYGRLKVKVSPYSISSTWNHVFLIHWISENQIQWWRFRHFSLLKSRTTNAKVLDLSPLQNKQHRVFSIVGSSAWNSLSAELRSLPRDLSSSFYKLLKTFIFFRAWARCTSE